MSSLLKQRTSKPLSDLLDVPLSATRPSPIQHWLHAYKFTRFHTHTTKTATFAYPCLHTSPKLSLVRSISLPLTDTFHFCCLGAALGRYLEVASPFGIYFLEFHWGGDTTGITNSVTRDRLASAMDMLLERQLKSPLFGVTEHGANETCRAYQCGLDFLAAAEHDLYVPPSWKSDPTPTSTSEREVSPPRTAIVFDVPSKRTVSDYVFQLAADICPPVAQPQLVLGQKGDWSSSCSTLIDDT